MCDQAPLRAREEASADRNEKFSSQSTLSNLNSFIKMLMMDKQQKKSNSK